MCTGGVSWSRGNKRNVGRSFEPPSWLVAAMAKPILVFAGLGKASFLNVFYQYAPFICGSRLPGLLSEHGLEEQSNGCLAFLRLVGTTYFKKHLSAFFTVKGFRHTRAVAPLHYYSNNTRRATPDLVQRKFGLLLVIVSQMRRSGPLNTQYCGIIGYVPVGYAKCGRIHTTIHCTKTFPARTAILQ